jgi:hypothetical protein
MVCQDLGLDTGAYSFGYVATWAGGGEQAVVGIKASCLRIQRAATFILSAIEQDRPDPFERSLVLVGGGQVN